MSTQWNCLHILWDIFCRANIMPVNTLRPRRNEQHWADDIFKRIFFNENVWVSIKIWLKFVPKGPINNIPALVRIMAWRRSGDKPLSEPMMVSLPTHICVTRPQWVNGWALQLALSSAEYRSTMSGIFPACDGLTSSLYVTLVIFSISLLFRTLNHVRLTLNQWDCSHVSLAWKLLNSCRVGK